MSENMTITIIDVESGQVSERALTQEEITEREQMQSDWEQLVADKDAKIAARESALAKLAALGLTAEEIDAL